MTSAIPIVIRSEHIVPQSSGISRVRFLQRFCSSTITVKHAFHKFLVLISTSIHEMAMHCNTSTELAREYTLFLSRLNSQIYKLFTTCNGHSLLSIVACNFQAAGRTPSYFNDDRYRSGRATSQSSHPSTRFLDGHHSTSTSSCKRDHELS